MLSVLGQVLQLQATETLWEFIGRTSGALRLKRKAECLSPAKEGTQDNAGDLGSRT